MSTKGVYIYDIETLVNMFSYYGIHRDTGESVCFFIWEDFNQIEELLNHLNNECVGQIGFNNIGFDYPVLHYILENQHKLISMSGPELVKLIYKKAQATIKAEYPDIRKPLIPQLDLFRIHHYNNKARMTSLKKLEINLGFENVQDMPYAHNTKLTDLSQIVEVLRYNKNDVEATRMFYEKTIPKLDLRRGIKKKYGLDCLNYPDSKIGEELMLKLYCSATGKDERWTKKQRTRRYEFKFSDCIPSYVKFVTPEFNELLEYLKTITVKELKDSFAYSLEYKGFKFDLGTGGIHGSIKPGVYKADGEEMIIKDSDVASLYPSLAIANNLYPEHLGEEFGEIYENGIVKPRLKAKKEGDKVMADGFKLSANSVYGKSNSEYSFLYDPLYTLKTTLAGQLSLCMLSEQLMKRIPDFTMLQINTDGLTSLFPKKYDKVYEEICDYWEKCTKLTLEHVYYDKMVIRDVNSYISRTPDGKIKRKGIFKRNEDMIADGEFHKSFSQGIVPIALTEFFINDVPVEDTIRNSKDIFLFCKTANTIGEWKAETYRINNDGEETDIRPEQKNIRYYVSTDGKSMRKCHPDGRKIGIETDKLVTVFNVYEEKDFTEYNIDVDYYVAEVYKIIHKIDGTEEREERERKEKREMEKREREYENFKKFCLDKAPTKRQLGLYGKQWLLDKYGTPLTREQIKEQQL